MIHSGSQEHSHSLAGYNSCTVGLRFSISYTSLSDNRVVINGSTNGVPFRSIGEVGVVGILFIDITMYLHFEVNLKGELRIKNSFQ